MVRALAGLRLPSKPLDLLRNADAAAGAGLALVLCAVYAGFFDRYAFDDSYVGYTIARSLLLGHGFAFNLADRTLSTSAPLAPPIYAALSALTHLDVVFVAQVLSAVAMAAVAYGSYALARRYARAPGAFCAAVILVCSPFTLLLWSHESLLYLALGIVGLNLFASGSGTAAALVCGLAALLRGEALLLLPFLWIAQLRREGKWSAAVFAVVSLLPFAVWADIATHLFGGFASQTIASKHVQLLYPSTLPYLLGALEYTIYTFSFDHTRIASAIVLASAGIAVYGAIANKLFTLPYRAVFLWALLTTSLYVVLGLEFYFWFLVQFAVALAACAAALWPRDRAPAESPAALRGARIAAAAIAAACALFLGLEMRRGIVRDHYWSAAVMPELHSNAYRRIGEWFAEHSTPGDRIAYPEFGQMRYYSYRDMVDYLGLVSTGATAQLADGDAIWTFKKYRPEWVVEEPTWHVFVNPLEYDWFRAAYRYESRQTFAGDPTRDDFTIYRLERPDLIPPPAVLAHDVRVKTIVREDRGLRYVFVTRHSAVEQVEARVRIPAACSSARLVLERSGVPLASRSETVTPGRAERLSLLVPQAASGTFAFAIAGCAVMPAPPLPLRRGVPRFAEPPIGHAPPDASLIVYTQTPPQNG